MFRAAVLLAMFAAAVSVGAAPAQAATSPWRGVASPTSVPDSTLNGVAAVSTTDAWAVGYADGADPLVEHWNGTQWSIVPTTAVDGDTFEYVTAPTVSNVTILGRDRGGHLVILHYNGSSWARTMPPMPRNSDGEFGVATALSATDVWISVGVALDHWNGHGWKGILGAAPSPIGPWCGFAFTGIHAITDTNVWFTTSYECNIPGVTFHGSLDQWNGSKVIHHGAPSGPAGQTRLNTSLHGITSTPEGDVWAVGFWAPPNLTINGPLAGYWNGSKWTSPTPNYYSTPHMFTAVAAASPTSVWATGWRSGVTKGTYNLLEYWNGSTWTEWGGPNPDPYTNTLNAVAAVPHSTQFWAVGSSGDDPNTKTMILHCCS